jgi:hypothetical protein
MSGDRGIDELLARYRPAGPPEHLRARVLAAQQPVRRAWPWAAAAAALLAGVCVLQLSTRGIYRSVAQEIDGPAAVNVDDFPALRAAIADDDLLKRVIESAQAFEMLEPAQPPARSVF